MSRKFVAALAAAITFVCTAALMAQTPARSSSSAFTLTSSDVTGGAFKPAQLMNGFGCTGGNVSPELKWTGAPAGTKSFVVTIYDPDAPTGSGFWHWVVFNIPASATELPNGASKTPKMPAGAIESRIDTGAPGYGGPCPPAGDKAHRYIFTVHALKVDKLDLDANAPAALVGFNVHMNTLGSATFTASYGR